MTLSTHDITFQELSLLGQVELPTRRLRVEFSQSDLILHINNSFKPPISWFLTDESGELIKMGQICDENYFIDLSDLGQGVYSLRIAGEIHMIGNLN